MLELLHKKSNALQAVYERNQVLAKYLAADDTDEALKQLAYCNQLIVELADIERQLDLAEQTHSQEATPQQERQARMERSMQRAILDRLQGLMEKNMRILREKTEAARDNVKDTRTTREGLSAYAAAENEYSGAHLDATR
ncbi:MAG: hypothetical protein PHO41_09505 [Eubacteriales bacterium]|nr:hypothetical protein [Eubacteriales bacterium]